ncbi:hypothetical protein GX51_00181 [Blastomyces parvus]|uniref:RBR-type E3 ubiquitin transferase n=1 Tax=Blastomyces parvus TaxID=2060905 RepID=A0A2B7XP58_9EURO|nr:hypothetical protein GX51_00181 [Blastomyces parvus]
MGCSNSTQAGEEPDAERTVVKSLEHYQIGKASTNSTLLPDFQAPETTTQTGLPLATDSAADAEFSLDVVAENEREFDVTMLELASEIFTEQYGNPDFAPGVFVKEFDIAMMEIADEIFTEQYGNPEIPAVVYSPGTFSQECSICYQDVLDAALTSPCKSCTTRTCRGCIRKMFISACSDESRMPPRCCGPLNIGAAVSVLTPDELETFKSKHEEWATANPDEIFTEQYGNPDFAPGVLVKEFDIAMMEIADEIFTEQYGNPDFAPGVLVKEFDIAMMEIADEIFTEQYGNPEIPAVVYSPGTFSQECSICYQDVLDAALTSPCKSCTTRTCRGCIRKMFISACSDESRMPPRCCGPLNIGAAVSVLTPDELETFKSKHEEWATANRVYCPVPTCSAFIPYRLFPADYRHTSAKPKADENLPESPRPTQLQTPPPTPPTSTTPPPPEPPSIPCPGCSIEICCNCKQLAHQGTLCREDAGELDPELAALLKKWRIKRCPKCRGAVRLMYGCNHMACRCGDQWCWQCTQPIDVCQSYGCDNDGSDEESEPDDSDFEEYDNDNENENENRNDEGSNQTPPENRDLDRRTRDHWEGENVFFGEEPVIQHYDPIDCYHTWLKATTQDVNQNMNFACEKCWRHITPRQLTYPEVVELMEHGFIPEKPVPEGGNQEKPGERLLMCTRCSIMLCDDCRDEDNAKKVAGKTWEFS